VYAPQTVDARRPEPIHPRAGVWAVVVAGGNGTRFGGRKQFSELAGRPVLAWSIDMARRACAGVVVVMPPTDEGEGVGALLAAALDRADKIVTGGALRSDSVRAGLAVVPFDAEIVAVHDAARPLSGPDIWTAVLDAVAQGADGAIPVVAVADTITRLEVGGARTPVDRSVLRAVQTPQAFRAHVLREAHARHADATDDATLVEAAGGRVVLVDGHPVNLKITTPSDLMVAGALLSAEVHGR
jgi:2-C-methyl-D-erythritol 4-phosphate cytidylyltransferase